MHRASPRRRRRLFVTLSVLLSLGLIGTAVVDINYDTIRAQYLKLTLLDFEGPGEG
jgi:hypothetical protein